MTATPSPRHPSQPLNCKTVKALALCPIMQLPRCLKLEELVVVSAHFLSTMTIISRLPKRERTVLLMVPSDLLTFVRFDSQVKC